MKAIVLTRGRIATVDDEDFDRVNQFKWCTQKVPNTYYAIHVLPTGERLYLHRFILGLEKGDVREGDHKNSDGLDCRRENLRVTTPLQNVANRSKLPGTTSRFKGVRRQTGREDFRAQIRIPGSLIRETRHLGCFKDELSAAKAYDKAARELFGEFAKLNFPI